MAPATVDAAAAPAERGAGAVLVIDDEVEVGELVAEILTRDGFHVTTATSGEEALGLIRTRRFDAIVSDLRMPGMDGMELHARLSEMSPELLSQLGFMTGDTMGARAHAFLEATGAPHVDKPILPEDLRGLLARLIGAGPQARA
jgi:CheY-like chemotaxis protein